MFWNMQFADNARPGLELNFFMSLPIGQPASKFWLPKWKLWLPIPQNSVAQNTEEFLYFAVINSNAVNVKEHYQGHSNKFIRIKNTGINILTYGNLKIELSMVCLNKFAKCLQFLDSHPKLSIMPNLASCSFLYSIHGNSVFHAGTNFCFRLASYANGRLDEVLEAVTEDCSLVASTVIAFSSSDDPLAKKLVILLIVILLIIGKQKQNGVSHGLSQDSWDCLPLFHAHIQIPPFGTWMPD